MDSQRSARVLRAILRPEIPARWLIKRLAIGSLEFRSEIQALDKPEYAYGVRQAIFLASQLKHKKVSVIEFGVGTGGSLKLLEQYSEEFGSKAGIDVEVFGFDLGTGLPSVRDYRDLPYVWKQGAYKMDVPKVQSELKRAQLILGNVRETAPAFKDRVAAPVGFISFDLDYYSSTVDAFQIFNLPDERILPRVVCYFDDIVSDSLHFSSEYAGELLAVKEFNRQSENHKLAPMYMAESRQPFPASWLQQSLAYHRFGHSDYNTYLGM